MPELPLDERPAPLSGNKAIEDAAIAFVLDLERQAGRSPVDRRYEKAYAADIESLVGVRYSDSNHAARPWYSWMSPPSRSRRRTPRGPTDSVSLGSARGGASPRARWGRCRL